MYQIVTLGTPFFLEELKDNLKDYPTISFLTNEDDVDEKYPHLYLYYGQTEEDANFQGGDISLDRIVKDMSILPIVKDIKAFGNVTPKDLATINALEFSNISEISRLKNFVLSYFGNLDGNKKIFISYKRDDTSGLAMQLFDALSKAGYIPFLDSYSIDSGKPFQEYLKHELSDSEIMLYLNSPNFHISPYTREELNVASELNVGIVQLKFNQCAIRNEVELSFVVEMGDCLGKDDKYDEKKIYDIIKAVDSYRALAFEQRRKSLIQELMVRGDVKGFVYDASGYYISADNRSLIHPLPRIPKTIDFQYDEVSNAGKNCSIVYNGMYCRTDIRTHIQWLNTKSQTTKCVDISKL